MVLGAFPGVSCRGGSEQRCGPLSSLRALAGGAGGGGVASPSEKASCTLHRGTPMGRGAWSRDKPASRGPGGAAEQQVGRRRQAVLSTSHCQVHLKLTGPQYQSCPGSEAVGLALESSLSENGWRVYTAAARASVLAFSFETVARPMWCKIQKTQTSVE